MSALEKIQDAIPVIDISKPSEEIAQRVLDAASTHGFLYIKNDGVTIPPQDIDDMFKLVCYARRPERDSIIKQNSRKGFLPLPKSRSLNTQSTPIRQVA